MELLYGWDVRAVACGAAHVVAVTPEDVITWGANEAGQCGHGERAEEAWVKPRSLKVLHGAGVVQVACGRRHTLCVTATSAVYAWGRNGAGQLGLGDAADRRSPALVAALWALPVTALAAGDAHSAALTSNGFLFTWGGNEAGQLGLPAAAEVAAARDRSASERRAVRRRVNARFVAALAEMGVPREQAELALEQTGNVGVEVAAEWLFSVPADVLESALSGEEPAGAPGSPASSLDAVGAEGGEARVLAPRRAPLRGVRAVAAGWNHTLAVTDEEVYAWGDNSSGQLGLCSLRSHRAPAEVADLAGAGVVAVAAGAAHSLFLCRDGRVFGCGDAGGGALAGAGARAEGAGLTEDAFWRAALADDDSGGAGAGAPVVDEAGSPMEEDNLFAALREAQRSGGMRASPDFDADEALALEGRGGGGAAGAEVRYVTAPALLRLGFAEGGGRGASAPVVTAVVAAGGASAFLTRAADELPEPPAPRLGEKLGALVAQARAAPPAEREQLLPSLAAALERVFGSAAALSAAFGSADAVGIDPSFLDHFTAQVLELDGPAPPGADPEAGGPLRAALRRGFEALVGELERSARLLGTPERAQVLLAALQSPLLGDARAAPALIPRACAVALAAPPATRRLLVTWWAAFPGPLLEARVVRPLQRYLTDELCATKKLTVSVMNAIKVLAAVDEANALGRRLPPDAFYNELISEKLDVLDHYVAWRQTHDMPAATAAADGPFSFCSYAFLLNARAKSKLLHTEARIQMDQTVASARAEQASPGRGGAADAAVVPSRKPPRGGEGGAAGLPPPRAGSPGGGRRRRGERDSGGGLRWLFAGRGPGGAAPAGALAEAEAAAAARPASPAADASTGAGSALWKQGSLGLPAPDDSGFPGTHPDMCILRVRRGHLVADALAEVARQRARDLLKPLRVHFIGEDGIDAGGVKKEFFQLLVGELLSPDYGMLVPQPESRTYWFNAATLEPDESFLLLGLVVGLAVYNGVLLDLPLPLALYRKVLGLEVGLRDLEEMQPTLGRSLRQLLAHEGPGAVEDVFCQTFAVAAPGVDGSVGAAALIPGGESVAVTEDNRREFVDLYVAWWLATSVHAQFEAFARGLLTLCGGPALQLFSATELERLVCGSPVLDFDALLRSARYDGGFHPEHRVVQWLWATVAELTPDERRLFLKFFTGSDRAPIGGLGNLRVVVQRDGPDSAKLPTSHTCFNTLLLPSYRSRERLADRLRLAILNAEGFGLE
jgi:ubiquitin-protein ligase E3 A